MPSRSPVPQHYSRSPAQNAVAKSPAHSLSHLDDALFKSPIMSPSYPPLARTPNQQHHMIAQKIMSPGPHHQQQLPPPTQLHDQDFARYNPGSPNKSTSSAATSVPRHRIRPIPALNNNNNQNDEGELRIPHQRVRHISTSSTTSVTKFVPQQVGRIRTESSCSAYSDVSVFKPRRAARSDDYMRLCEARRELLKKCNGETPDKSQLRMYDMIYYNPKTNPMKRHLEEEKDKEGEGGGSGAEGSDASGGAAKKDRRASESSSHRAAVAAMSVKQEPKDKEPMLPVRNNGLTKCDS